MVLSAAKREKDFYLSKIEKSRAMTEIDARMEKVLTLSNIVNSEVLYLTCSMSACLKFIACDLFINYKSMK